MRQANNTMFESKSIHDLETFLDYSFQDPKIATDVRQRKAFLSDKQAVSEECMDPLATIGDAVLNLIAVNRLYNSPEHTKDTNHTKGELTELRSHQVRRERTRAFAKKNHLFEYIQWGKGELKQKQWNTDTALDTVTEAILGAMFLDAQKRGWNGINVVCDFLERKQFF